MGGVGTSLGCPVGAARIWRGRWVDSCIEDGGDGGGEKDEEDEEDEEGKVGGEEGEGAGAHCVYKGAVWGTPQAQPDSGTST